jgi:hypothetical protein
MITLTLYSADQSEFLARVVDRDGSRFVLPQGDRKTIARLSRRIQRGFTTHRFGEQADVKPVHPQFLNLLAEHCMQEGMLAFLEEPHWEGRMEEEKTWTLDDDDDEEEGDATELMSAEALERLRATM